MHFTSIVMTFVGCTCLWSVIFVGLGLEKKPATSSNCGSDKHNAISKMCQSLVVLNDIACNLL